MEWRCNYQQAMLLYCSIHNCSQKEDGIRHQSLCAKMLNYQHCLRCRYHYLLQRLDHNQGLCISHIDCIDIYQFWMALRCICFVRRKWKLSNLICMNHLILQRKQVRSITLKSLACMQWQLWHAIFNQSEPENRHIKPKANMYVNTQ